MRHRNKFIRKTRFFYHIGHHLKTIWCPIISCAILPRDFPPLVDFRCGGPGRFPEVAVFAGVMSDPLGALHLVGEAQPVEAAQVRQHRRKNKSTTRARVRRMQVEEVHVHTNTHNKNSADECLAVVSRHGRTRRKRFINFDNSWWVI